LASPHCDARPQGVQPSLIVLHAITLPSGEFGMNGVRDLFMGCLDCDSDPRLSDLAHLRVSAHCVIDRGGAVQQFVPLSQRAWHAGVSCWQGKSACNDFSIGIEMIGDEQTPFSDAQYRVCAGLCHAMHTLFPTLARNAITGHQNIAPSRKWDPGVQWQWSRFHALLSHPERLPLIEGLQP